MNNTKAKSFLFTKGVPFVFYLALLVFLVIYLKGIDFEVFKNATFKWQYLVIASLFGMASRFWQVFIWYTLLKSLGAEGLRKNILSLTYVYAKSWMGRYIPGTAPWILGKIYFASKLGISKNKLAVSSLLEGGLQVVAVMAVSFIMLVSDTRLDVISVKLKVFMFCILLLLAVTLIPPVFNKIISAIYQLIKQKKLIREHYADGASILRGLILYVVASFSIGLSLFFIAKSVYPTVGYENLLFIMGTGNLAGAISMLAFFAPSGLGVREGIQLGLLSLIMPTEFALLVTVVTRLWSVSMDVLFFVSSKLIYNIKSN